MKARWPMSSTDYVDARRRVRGKRVHRPHVTGDCRADQHDRCPEGREITELCFCPCHPNDRGVLYLDGYEGRTQQVVRIVGETPKRYRIAPYSDTPVRLAGRARYLQPGETALVPKSAVRSERDGPHA